MQLEVDGVLSSVRGSGTLLEALREDLGKTCVKDGCAPQGQCGACTVLVDGEARLACVTPVARVEGRSVTTVDGLAEPLRTRLAGALARSGGYVCGFCTPGIIVRSHRLLSGGGGVDADSIGTCLAPNLCRCTGWQGVVHGIELAGSGADVHAEGDPPLDVALGRHRFLADDDAGVRFWVVPVLAGVGKGTFRSVTGEMLLTAAALPPRRLPYGRVLTPGDTVADAGDVAALAYGPRLSDARAAAAAARVQVEPAAHTESGARAAQPTAWSTPPWDPGFLEPEAAFARLEGGVLHVRTQTETPREEERLLSLAWPEAAVEVEVVSNGGSYGAKAGAGPAALAALAAEALGGGALVVFGRRESILWHRRRRPARCDVVLDVVDGRLRRIDGVLVVAGGGADPGPNPYRAQAAVQVQVVPGRPAAQMRAEGMLQWTFALEREVDRVGVDRAASLHPVPFACVSAVGDGDGVAVAGAPAAAVAAGVRLDEDGRVDRVLLAYSGAADVAGVHDSLVSGAFMGLGCALSEDLPLREGVPTPATIRSLGLLRCGQTPPVEVRHVAHGDADAAAEAPLDAYAVAAVPPALANALRRRFGIDASVLPMRDTPPARAIRRR